jgi:hypothetical protein
MKYFLSITLLLLSLYRSFSQKRNAVWCFGDSSGIDFNDTLVPTTFTSGMNAVGSCATICDSLGNLLFYCASPDINAFNNGTQQLGIVYNRNHEKMLHGDSLNCRAWYHEMVIVPDPNNTMQFFIFHIGVTGLYGLYYSIVDIAADSGKGEVISKNNQLQNDLAQDCIQAVKHGNGQDWWVLFHSPQHPDSFFVYSISMQGVYLHHINTLGVQSTSNGGDLRFNSTGSQFAYCSLKGLLSLYDFDRCTGNITINKTIHTEDPGGNYPYFIDVCFSPNDSLLYMSCAPAISSFDSTQIYLYQLPLWQANVYASKVLIWNQISPLTIGAVRLAPDHKIYVATQSTGYPYDSTNYYPENMSLSVINEPNNIGASCNFQPYSFYLNGKRTYWGLPNNPPYDLPALAGSLCDTINSGITAVEDASMISVYPNPFVNSFRITTNAKASLSELVIFNSDGRKVLSEKSLLNNAEINLSAFGSGVYFIQVKSGTSVFRKMVVKIE